MQDVALSRDGNLLLTNVSYLGGEIDDPPRLWDVNSGRELHRLASPNVNDVRAKAIAISPDGSRAATVHFNAKDEAVILFWDTASGRETLTLKANSGLTGFAAQFNAIVFSADGKLLATASNDRTIRLWDRDAQTGKLKAVLFFTPTQAKNYQQPSLFDFTPKRLDVFLRKQPPKQ